MIITSSKESPGGERVPTYNLSYVWLICVVAAMGGLLFGYDWVVSFKPINAALGAAGTFWLYGAICLVGFAVMWFRVPETKGKSLEAIERELTD